MTAIFSLLRMIEEMPEETSEDTIKLIQEIKGFSEFEREEVNRFNKKPPRSE